MKRKLIRKKVKKDGKGNILGTSGIQKISIIKKK